MFSTHYTVCVSVYNTAAAAAAATFRTKTLLPISGRKLEGTSTNTHTNRESFVHFHAFLRPSLPLACGVRAAFLYFFLSFFLSFHICFFILHLLYFLFAMVTASPLLHHLVLKITSSFSSSAFCLLSLVLSESIIALNRLHQCVLLSVCPCFPPLPRGKGILLPFK